MQVSRIEAYEAAHSLVTEAARTGKAAYREVGQRIMCAAPGDSVADVIEYWQAGGIIVRNCRYINYAYGGFLITLPERIELIEA